MYLIFAAAVAMIWANSPFADAYQAMISVEAIKGVAIFTFFLSLGIELRHEITQGSLAKPRQAIVPILAAIGGMLVPVALYSLINRGLPTAAGWGVPMSTDVAFALAVLAIAGKFLPASIRVFLLTVAVVDDSLTILMIALFFSSTFHALSVVSLAGVVSGLFLPSGQKITGWLTPTVNYVALPVFALFSAGVNIQGLGSNFSTSAITLGVIVAMVVGKPLGVLGTTWLVTKSGLGKLAAGIKWADLISIGSLFGMCFTVALLMSELSFGEQHTEHSIANLSVFIGSLASALLAVVALQIRKRAYVAN
jgi:Na+:H+ antiporter, NhaA family